MYKSVLKLKQNLEDTEYEDDLSQYLKLHYKLLHHYSSDIKIGEVYYKKIEGEYYLITHQIIDSIQIVKIIYNTEGELLQTGISSHLSIEHLKDFTYVCTYNDLVKNKDKRIQLGLKYEKGILEKRLKEINDLVQ